MNAASLTTWEQLLLIGLFTILFIYFLAWFFEKIFAWDKSDGKKRKYLSFQWHCIKAVIVGLPTSLIAYAFFGLTWYAVLVWINMALVMWVGFDLLLNMLRNLKDIFHHGTNVLDQVPWAVKFILLAVSITGLIIYTISFS